MRVAYQDLTLLDRFLFAEVMEDSKTFENILSIIPSKAVHNLNTKVGLRL